MGVVPGIPKCQTFWEYVTLLLALITWCDNYTTGSVAVLGDSQSALQDAINLSGRREMLAVSREVAWRKIRGNWQFMVGHLPAEFNLFADALSRSYAPETYTLPAELRAATERTALNPMQVWRAVVHIDLA
jgi:hypothetical protein